MLQLEYDLTHDEHGIFDGRDVALALIRSAYQLVLPYTANCPACASAIVAAHADHVLCELLNDCAQGCGAEGSFMTVGEPDSASQMAHLTAAEEKTINLIRKRQLHVGQIAHGLGGCPEAGDLDDDIPF